MAVSVVQSSSASQNGQFNSSNTITFAAAPTQGNLILIGYQIIEKDGDTTQMISGFSALDGKHDTKAGTISRLYTLAVKVAGASEGTSYTVAMTPGDQNKIGVVGYEFSGVDNANPLAGVAPIDGNDVSDWRSSNVSSPGLITPARAGAAFFVMGLQVGQGDLEGLGISNEAGTVAWQNQEQAQCASSGSDHHTAGGVLLQAGGPSAEDCFVNFLFGAGNTTFAYFCALHPPGAVGPTGTPMHYHRRRGMW